MPAWSATAFSTAEVIGSDTRTTTGTIGRLRRLLVTGSAVMTVFQPCSAGLMLRTLLDVEAFDRGYRADSVLLMLVDPLGSKYPTQEALQQFYDQVEVEIAAVFFFQAEDGIRDGTVTGVQTCALPIFPPERGTDYATRVSLSLPRDSWVVAEVTGSDNMFPVLTPTEFPPLDASVIIKALSVEIGRASCRERVSISVVAGSLKKKKNKRR